nr:hypothetical protein [Tanacetum cinerariifolium]
MEEMTAMTRRGHERMMRMMIWPLRPMRRRRSTQLLPTLITIIPLVFTTASYSFSTTIPDTITTFTCKKLGIALGLEYEVGESSSAAAARPAGGLRADYGFVTTMDREIMRVPEREVGYEITDSWDEIVETLQGAPVSTDTKLGGYMREFETRVRQDTEEIYMRLDDEQSERQLLAGRLNLLFRDRCAHAYTRHLMETEARMSREAWVRSTDASDLVRGEGLAGGLTQLELPEEADYIPGPEEQEQTPPLPDYIPGPEHADDEIVAKDQPYAEDASP